MHTTEIVTALEALHELARRQLDIVAVWGTVPHFKEKHPLHAPPRQMALCPFHMEKTPSCRVYSRSQRFHCYGCGESGDVVYLLEKVGECEEIDYIIQLPESMQEDRARALRQTLEWYAGRPLTHSDTLTKPLF